LEFALLNESTKFWIERFKLDPDEKLMQKKESTSFSFGYLLSLMSQYRSGIALIILFNLLWTLFQICIPFLTKALVDNGIQNRDISVVWIILIAQLILFVGITIADMFRKWLLRHIGVRVNLQLILNYLSAIIRKPYDFFSIKEQGKTIQHFNDNLRIETFLTNKSSDFLDAILKIGTFGILLFVFNTQTGIIFFSFTIFLVVWISFFLDTREVIDEERFKISSIIRSELIEIFSGIIDLKSYNQEIKRINSWDKVQTRFSNIRLNLLKISQLIYGGIDSFAQIRDILILFVAAKATIDGNMTLGTLIAIQYILGNLNQPIKQLIDFVPQYQDAQLSISRINSAMAHEDLESSYILSEVVPKTADINIAGVSYAYSPTKLAVTKVNIQVPFGKSVALLGESGSGKSTLMKLMLKLLQPKDGHIAIGAKKLDMIKAKSWLENCSVVLQESILFQRSVLYNLTFEEDVLNVDIEKVTECLKLCEAQTIIDALPNGLSSIVGQEHINFSKGQAQRIILARALYKDVDYYFLDEPFSALDRLTYKKVFKNIRNKLENKTLIIVTHKMEVAMKMDKIYLLEEGLLIESGTHDSLSKLGQQYSKIFLSDDE